MDNTISNNEQLEKLFNEEGFAPKALYGREKRRCTICNKVNSPDIASDFGEFTGEPFHDDLCHECHVAVQDAKSYYSDTDGNQGLEEYLEQQDE